MGFDVDTKYMVAMIVEDEAHNKSPVSNVQEVFIASPYADLDTTTTTTIPTTTTPKTTTPTTPTTSFPTSTTAFAPSISISIIVLMVFNNCEQVHVNFYSEWLIEIFNGTV